MALPTQDIIDRWFEFMDVSSERFDPVTKSNARILKAEMMHQIPSTDEMVLLCKAQLSRSWKRSPESLDVFHRRIGTSGDVDLNQTRSRDSIQRKFDKKMKTMLEGRENFLNCRFGRNFIRFVLLECEPELKDVKKRFQNAVETRLETFGFPTRIPSEVASDGSVLTLRYELGDYKDEDFEDIEYDSDEDLDSNSTADSKSDQNSEDWETAVELIESRRLR